MKIKTFFKVVLPLSVFLMFGCASTGIVSVSVKPNTSFTPKSTITVVYKGNYDPLKVQGRLERLLMSRGYEVVSSAVANDKIKYEDKIRSKDSGESEAEASLQRVQEFHSIYILQFDYNHFWTKDDCFEYFTASIIDLKTGEVAASADFSQGWPDFGCRSATSVLEEFVDKLKAK